MKKMTNRQFNRCINSINKKGIGRIKALAYEYIDKARKLNGESDKADLFFLYGELNLKWKVFVNKTNIELNRFEEYEGKKVDGRFKQSNFQERLKIAIESWNKNYGQKEIIPLPEELKEVSS